MLTERVFLLGAGFNRDAPVEAGPIFCPFWGDEIKHRYPLVQDLAEKCFPGYPLAAGESIELRFEQAQRDENLEPLRILCRTLMETDYWIAPKLANPNNQGNPYAQFFSRFGSSVFLTYNYDSLAEYLLFRQKRWYPHDGFGVSVEAQSIRDSAPPKRSSSLVLHLHGSLCVFTPRSLFGQLATAPPQYYFHPGSIGHLFPDYGISRGFGHVDVEERVIAPVPNKAQGLNEPFIKAVHLRAHESVASTSRIVSIGYSFNAHDESSYDSLITEFGRTINPTVVLVSPDADQVKSRLCKRYPLIGWIAIPSTFSQWAGNGFPEV